jgi:hypothetical protein
MVRCATRSNNVNVLPVGRHSHVAPQLLRAPDQVPALLGAEHTMNEIVRVCMRHKSKANRGQ